MNIRPRLSLPSSQGPSPPVKLYKHRVDGTDGSGAPSYGEVRSDITMSYKPIAPAPSGSNHTPPGFCRLSIGYFVSTIIYISVDAPSTLPIFGLLSTHLTELSTLPQCSGFHSIDKTCGPAPAQRLVQGTHCTSPANLSVI